MKKQFTHLQQDDQEDSQDAYKAQNLTNKQKILYFFLLIAFIGSTFLNLWTSNYQNKGLQKFVESELSQKQKDLYEKIINDKKQLEVLEKKNQNKIFYKIDGDHQGEDKVNNQNALKYDFTLSDKVKQRISYGQPRPKNYLLRAVVVFHKRSASQKYLMSCIFTNGITIISNKTTYSAKNFLQQQSVRKWIVLIDDVDEVADKLIEKLLKDLGKDYQMNVFPITIDANYQILIKLGTACQSMIYLQNYFIVNPQQVKKLLTVTDKLQKQQKSGYIGYTMSAKINQINTKLSDLREIDFYQFKQQKFNQYIYVFDNKFLQIITPINFIHFNKYTIQQIIINPILIITQKSNSLIPINQTLHQFDQAVVQFKQYQLKQSSIKQPSKQRFCFVGYPTVPNFIEVEEFKGYLESIGGIGGGGQQIRVVVHFPYNFEDKTSINDIYKILRTHKQSNPRLQIKLRIKQFKSVSSISVFESARTYCQQKSIMITSRYNIEYKKNIIQQLSNIISQKYHYYYSSNQIFYDRKNVLKYISSQDNNRFNINNYIKYFSSVQIFKNNLMNMINPWVLKCQEDQFLQSEAAFILPMLEMVDYNMEGKFQLHQVKKQRQPDQQQYKQLQQLNKYGKWDKISDGILKPISYNPLVNLQLRRGTLQAIPRTIHQIWFRDDQIPQRIKAYQKTIKEIHPDYQYMLWKKQNLSFYNFPMSYPLVVRTLEYQWASGKSYHPWIQALFSYQVLYNNGGIYLGLNVQVKKSLDPFLRYQLFFAGYYGSEGFYDMPLSFKRDIIASKRHGYHLRMVLTEMITPKRVNYELEDYQAMLGGDVLRLAMTDNQVYTTVAFGFYLFNYDPYSLLLKKCNVNQNGCRSFDEAYILLHDFNE